MTIERGFLSRLSNSRFASVSRIMCRISLTLAGSSSMLNSALRSTVNQMRRDAAARGVQVATNYYFSFTAERDRLMFDKPGLLPLSVQLGEVKAICDVLFAARVNAIDNIRREKVSLHDTEAQQSNDYLDRTTMTNDIALVSPYEVSLRCFSSEVAAILSGFASSPNGLIVRAINVEPAVLGGEFGTPGSVTTGGYPVPTGLSAYFSFGKIVYQRRKPNNLI